MANYLAPAPVPNTFFIPGSNEPGDGVQVFFYVAGSVSTKQTVYQDSTTSTAWSNPIVLDAGGNLPTGTKEVWFPEGETFKVVYAPSNDTDPPASPYLTLDDLYGINDPTGISTAAEWQSGPTPTFISAASFSVSGDYTSVFTKGRRIQSTVTAGTVYSVVLNASFGSSITTVTVAGGQLDSGLSAVNYALLDPANPSISFYEVTRKASTTVPSATTTNIWGTDGDYVHITGNTPVANFSTAAYAGGGKVVVADGSTPILFNASTMALPGGQNMTTSPGQVLGIRAETTSQMILAYAHPVNASMPLVVDTADPTKSVRMNISSLTSSTQRQITMLDQNVLLPYLMSSITVTSLASRDFSIPSGAVRVTVMFAGISTNGTTGYLIQLGDAVGVENTGYIGGANILTNGGTTTVSANYSAGFSLLGGSSDAANLISGSLHLTLINSSTHTWAESHSVAYSNVAATASGGGYKDIDTELTTIRLISGNGTDTFDAGVVSVLIQ